MLADQLLFLRIDRDDWDSASDEVECTRVDVLELRVAIGVALAFFDPRVSLQRVIACREQIGDLGRAHGMAQAREFGRKGLRTLRGPPQRRLGVASGRWIDQGFEGGHHPRILLFERLSTCARPAVSNDIIERHSCADFVTAFAHGTDGHSCRGSDRGDTAPAHRVRFRSSPKPSRPLGHCRGELHELLVDPGAHVHAPVLITAGSPRRSPSID